MNKRTRSRLRGNRVLDRGGGCGHLLRLLDQRNCFQFLGDDGLRQLRVGQTFIVLLAVGQHPLQEALDRVSLGGVLNLRWNQQPGEAGDGIRRLAPGALVMETRKSSGMSFAAPAAAAVTPARSAFTNFPAAF